MFKSYNRNMHYLLPPSVEDWLPSEHLARFIVDIVAGLDLSSITHSYSARGEKAYDPEILLGLLFYGYATGVFSSRKIEQKSYTCLAFRYIAVNQHPDHDTIAHFRKRFLPQLKTLFFQILSIAREMGFPKVGKVSLDGTKIKANASKHRAFSYAYAEKYEQQLKGEIADLMKKAQEKDDTDKEEGMSIPKELLIRQERLKVIEAAKATIEQRAKERYAQEKLAYDRRIKQRKEKEESMGRKLGGKPPTAPISKPQPKDQVNLTDEESRIMPISGKGFQQCYNAQASVDIESLLIVGTHISNAPNDKQELDPALKALKQLPKEVAQIEYLLADTGYQSKQNLMSCLNQNINPLIAEKREKHHLPPEERFQEALPLAVKATALEKASHQLKTLAGKALYAKRKSTVEPVFGIIKNIMGFRQFMLRGIENVSGEWNLVSIAWNLKRLHKMAL